MPGAIVPRGLPDPDSPLRLEAEKLYRVCGILIALSVRTTNALGVVFPPPMVAVLKVPLQIPYVRAR
jgi:hypothetical protein